MEPRKPHPGPHSGRHGAHHALLFGLKHIPRRSWWVGGAVLALLAGALVAVLLLAEIDFSEVMDLIAALRPVPLILAMALLPVFAFPILPVYLIAGARFGPWGGGAVVTLVTAAHLFGTYLITRTVLRGPVQRLLSRRHIHLPEIPRDEEAAVALIAVLVPGLPYVVRNYLLAISGLRFWVYFWICLPIHVARSYVSILLGDLGTQPDRTRLFILGGVELAKVAICGLVIWWLRQHHRRVHGATVDPAPMRPTA